MRLPWKWRWPWRRRPEPAQAAPRVEPYIRPRMKVAPSVLTASGGRGRGHGEPWANPWVLPKPPPGVLPEGGVEMAMDDGVVGLYDWAASGMGYPGGLPGGLVGEGLSFMGYPWLAELTARPEYRRGSEIVAKEMTREWLKLTAAGEGDKSDIIVQITAELKRLKVQQMFRRASEHDGFFGRGHIYLDMGNDDPAELAMPLLIDAAKVPIGGLKRLTSVEPIWTYPVDYDTTNPLAPNFYRPAAWQVRGKKVHASRWLTFIAREVPDIMKPAYMFGGLSLSQMGKPAVDNWLTTRRSVSDLITAFSQMVLTTDLNSTLAGDAGLSLSDRLTLFNNTRDNTGVMAINKDTEDFKNVSAPLGTLDALQAQAQEHMPSIWGIPLVVYFGITPAGLSASTDGELAAWNTWVLAQQESLFNDQITKLLQIVQLSLFGKIDPDIGHQWIPLGKLSQKDKADIRKTDADTGAVLISAGVIFPAEERARIANDEETLYPGLDVDDVPEIDLTDPADDPADPDPDPNPEPALRAVA